MDCSIPGFSVHHHRPELAQTHVHWVSDAIQPSHPLSSSFLMNEVIIENCCCWVASVVSDSPQSHKLQHARLLCPSLPPRACSNSCPLSQWCYPTISSSAIPFSSRLQSFPASGSFPMCWLFTSGWQSIPSKEYSGLISFRIDWFDLLAFQGTLKSLHQHHSLKGSVLRCSAFFIVQLSHPYIQWMYGSIHTIHTNLPRQKKYKQK